MEHLLTNQSSETSSKLENFVQYLNQITDTDDPDNTERVKGVKMNATSSSGQAGAEFKDVSAGADTGSAQTGLPSLMDIATGAGGALPHSPLLFYPYPF